MRNRLHKKTLSTILTIAFSLVLGFGTFVNTASANLAKDLLNGLNLSEISVDAVPYVEDIPDTLQPDQAVIIINNILSNSAVNWSQQDVATKRAACAAILTAVTGITKCDGTEGTVSNVESPTLAEVNDLRAAVVKLGDALVRARNAENSTIGGFVSQNTIAANAAAAAAAINNSSGSAANNQAGQAGEDEVNAGTPPATSIPTPGESAADALKKKNDAEARAKAKSNPVSFKESCFHMDGIVPKLNLVSCAADLVYNVIYMPTTWALMGAGYLFDSMLMLSIDNSNKMVVPNFIESTWGIVRDFSNMLFIFILVYTGIMTMFGVADWAKTVRNVVIVALLINFSLFFSKVIIDAGNILALGLKAAINTPKISEGIAGAFSPQSFFQTGLDALKTDTTGGQTIIVYLVAAVVTGYTAYVFFKVALLFLGRLIAFWMLMILSPFAFVSITLPKGNKFQEWLDMLIAQAFLAPVFLFFMYILMFVVKNSSPSLLSQFAISPASSWFDSLIGPTIVAIIIIIALQKALHFTEGMAGDFGKLGSDMAGKAMGLAGGVALGATGLAGRALGGRVAQRLSESGTLARVATGKSMLGDSKLAKFVGRNAITINEKARTGTWDARGASFVQTAAKTAGIKDLGKPGESAKGGFEGIQKRQAEADEAFAKKLRVTDEEKAALGEASAVKNETLAKENLETATNKHKESLEEKEVATLTEKVKEGKTATENASKKTKRAKDAFDASMAMGGAQASEAQWEALNAAQKEEEEAAKKLKEEETNLASAITKSAGSETATALKAATEQLEKAGKEVKAVKAKIEEENDRRKGSYADYMEGRQTFANAVAGSAGALVGGVAGIAAGPVGIIAGAQAGAVIGSGLYGQTYSHKQAETTAKKIRNMKVSKEEAKETKKKDAAAMLKDLTTQVGDNKPTASPAATPAAAVAPTAAH